MTTPSSPPLQRAPSPLAGLELPSLRRKTAPPPRPRALVLLEPVGAFVATLRRPLLPLMLVVACAFAVVPAAAFLIAARRQGGVEVVVAEQMKKSGALDRLKSRVTSSDDRAKTVAGLSKAMVVLVPGGAVAKRLGWLLFVAGACFVGLRGTRKTLRFSDVLAVVVVGAAPLYVHDLVAGIGVLTLPAGTIDAKNVVASNLAAVFFVDDNRSALAVLLRGLDIFEIQACWLMGFGVVHVVGGRTTWPWMVTFGGHTAITAIGVLRAL